MTKDQLPSEDTPNPYQPPESDPTPRTEPLQQSFPVTPAVDGFAITSCILGLVSLFTCAVGIVLGSMAITFGHLALARMKRDPQNLKGKGFAIAGLVLGYFMSAITILFFATILF